MRPEYLKVIAEQGSQGLVVISANNESLKNPGKNIYPFANDYFPYLDNQEWHFVASNILGHNRFEYTFRGGLGYRVKWVNDRWQGENWLDEPFEDESWWNL